MSCPNIYQGFLILALVSIIQEPKCVTEQVRQQMDMVSSAVMMQLGLTSTLGLVRVQWTEHSPYAETCTRNIKNLMCNHGFGVVVQLGGKTTQKPGLLLHVLMSAHQRQCQHHHQHGHHDGDAHDADVHVDE